METIYAPWTREQVDALNRFQHGRMHPFTCGSPAHRQRPTLVATEHGWICPENCGYTQTWASAFMADPDLWAADPFAEQRKAAIPEMRRSHDDCGDKIADRIRAEFVCCNIFERVNDHRELTKQQAMGGKDWHDICYWGEASARIAEGRCPGYETDPNVCRCTCPGCKHNCGAHQSW